MQIPEHAIYTIGEKVQFLGRKRLKENFYTLPHGGIQDLQPYVPGTAIEELQTTATLPIVKMASNENPLGCSPYALEVLKNFSASQVATYPSLSATPLLGKLAEKLKISKDMLTLSNGSDLLFTLLLTAFGSHTKKAMLTHDYAFMTFGIQAQILNIPVIHTPLHADWSVNIAKMIERLDENIGLVFLANPNNPTGGLIDDKTLLKLLDKLPPKTLLVLDQAYFEYAYDRNNREHLLMLERYPNLILTRTFSKAYGLAGLRLGYAVADPSISDILHRIQLPFSANQAALQAAMVALDDEEFIQQTLSLTNDGKKQLQEGLDRMGLKYLPSFGNFITIDCARDGLPVYKGLLREGIIVRPLHPYRMNNYLRVTIGNFFQNQRFLDKLAILLNEPVLGYAHDH